MATLVCSTIRRRRHALARARGDCTSDWHRQKKLQRVDIPRAIFSSAELLLPYDFVR